MMIRSPRLLDHHDSRKIRSFVNRTIISFWIGMLLLIPLALMAISIWAIFHTTQANSAPAPVPVFHAAACTGSGPIFITPRHQWRT
ncbi:hypothetical protein [Granulibacter bethesdensis]|uniref:hypothetical protein n=1 Tax=Granulibacter bethesdensis TaxID=364410 RepID=UPI0003F218E6|nr:hypothetical protein [Granulibacter bethesdensis]AHJ69366.1 hypothetical protein GbCGDNIH2_7314 [Granulibacter bethesdensis]